MFKEFGYKGLLAYSRRKLFKIATSIDRSKAIRQYSKQPKRHIYKTLNHVRHYRSLDRRRGLFCQKHEKHIDGVILERLYKLWKLYEVI